jgi:hypothetical protein
MRLPIEEHLKHDWLVTSLAPDFELLDVWRYPVEIEDAIALDRFMDFMQVSQGELVSGHGVAGALFKLRAQLGRLFGWDEDERHPRSPLPIPGCTETSLRARFLDMDQLPQDLVQSSLSFKPVYRRDNEALLEISNNTVHAMMHLGRVAISDSHWSPQLGVYVKPRGRLGRFYMSLISPFRHYIVYPAMMRAAQKGWPRYLDDL